MNGLWMRQIGGVVRMELKRSFLSKRGWWIYFLALVPTVIIFVHLLIERHPQFGMAEDTMVLAGIVQLAVAAMAGMVEDLEPNGEAMRAAAAGGYSTATDLADWLVRALGLPFREAHHVTGRIVAAAEAKGLSLDKLPLADMRAVSPRITEAVYSVLSVQNSVKSRTSFGGTAPQNVRKMARAWIKRLEKAAGRV